MFTADGKPSDDDPRENRPRSGDEGTTLVEALRCQRLTLEVKCAGLDAGGAERRPPAVTNSNRSARTDGGR
jgi:hypothetical protein